MPELPKIVRERLRQRNSQSAVDRRSSGDLNASRAESLGAGKHPDANLLAAFAERRLTRSERTLLLGHLADCAQCRELVTLAFPSPEVQAAVAEGACPASASPGWLRRPEWLRSPAWLGWSTLRWGVLAASVGVVLIGGFRAGVLRWPASQKSGPTSSKSPVAENKQPSVLRAANDSSSSVRGAPSPRREPAEPGRLESGNAPAKPAEPPRPAAAQYHAGLKTKLKKQETASDPAARSAGGVLRADEAAALSSPAAVQAPPAKSAQAYSEERDQSRRAGQASAAQSQALTSSGFATPSDSLQAEKANPIPLQKSLGLQTVEAQTEAVSKEKTAPASKTEEVSRRRLDAMTQAPAPPPPAAAPSVDGGALALRRSDTRALAKDKRLLSAQWSIASVVGPYGGDSNPAIGRVERSLDGGKTWQELHVNDRVSFRAVAANSAEVWAGGSGGTLYHSTDGGQHWARVLVASDRGVVSDTIVSINVVDSRHVTVATGARERWVTTDGGQHWESH